MKGLKIQEKLQMDFTDGPLATTANLHRLFAQVMWVPGHHCYPAALAGGAGWFLGTPLPFSTPGHGTGQRLGRSNVDLDSAGGTEKKNMRSLQSGRAGCDRGVGRMEKQGAIVTLQTRGKSSCGDGWPLTSHQTLEG